MNQHGVPQEGGSVEKEHLLIILSCRACTRAALAHPYFSCVVAACPGAGITCRRVPSRTRGPPVANSRRLPRALSRAPLWTASRMRPSATLFGLQSLQVDAMLLLFGLHRPRRAAARRARRLQPRLGSTFGTPLARRQLARRGVPAAECRRRNMARCLSAMCGAAL